MKSHFISTKTAKIKKKIPSTDKNVELGFPQECKMRKPF